MLYETCICIIIKLVKFNQLFCTNMKFSLINLLLTNKKHCTHSYENERHLGSLDSLIVNRINEYIKAKPSHMRE
jgi:hypothetical protein